MGWHGWLDEDKDWPCAQDHDTNHRDITTQRKNTQGAHGPSQVTFLASHFGRLPSLQVSHTRAPRGLRTLSVMQAMVGQGQS